MHFILEDASFVWKDNDFLSLITKLIQKSDVSKLLGYQVRLSNFTVDNSLLRFTISNDIKALPASLEDIDYGYKLTLYGKETTYYKFIYRNLTKKIMSIESQEDHKYLRKMVLYDQNNCTYIYWVVDYTTNDCFKLSLKVAKDFDDTIILDYLTNSNCNSLDVINMINDQKINYLSGVIKSNSTIYDLKTGILRSSDDILTDNKLEDQYLLNSTKHYN